LKATSSLNSSGFSLIEVIVAVGLLSVVSLGVSEFITHLSQSNRQLDAQVRNNEIFTNIMAVLSNPERCRPVIGGGFDPAAAAPGVDIQIDIGPSSGVASLAMRPPEAYAVGNEIAPRLLIERMELTNVSTVGVDRNERYEPGGAPITVVRRTILADFVYKLKDNHVGAIDLAPKTTSLLLEIERLSAGVAWRIRDCRPPDNQGSQLGWSPSIVGADCSTTTANPDDVYTCPTGMYLVGQSFVPQGSPAQLTLCSCGKFGCGYCGSSSTSLIPTYTCCPSVR